MCVGGGVLGSAVSSPSGVWGEAPAEIRHLVSTILMIFKELTDQILCTLSIYSASKNGLTLKSGFGVRQGH